MYSVIFHQTIHSIMVVMHIRISTYKLFHTCYIMVIMHITETLGFPRINCFIPVNSFTFFKISLLFYSVKLIFPTEHIPSKAIIIVSSLAYVKQLPFCQLPIYS